MSRSVFPRLPLPLSFPPRLRLLHRLLYIFIHNLQNRNQDSSIASAVLTREFKQTLPLIMLTLLTSIWTADKGIPGGGHQYVKYTEWRVNFLSFSTSLLQKVLQPFVEFWRINPTGRNIRRRGKREQRKLHFFIDFWQAIVLSCFCA